MAKRDKILKDPKLIIEESGNNFHYNIVNILRNDGWDVDVGPYYNDNFSQKPREIDIIAVKWFKPLENSIYNSHIGVRLFIECKYITNTTVFWLDKRDMLRAKEVVRKNGNFHSPEENSLVLQKHHYLSAEKIVKLFDSGEKDQDREAIYRAITQSLNSLIYFRNRKPDSYEQHKKYRKVSLLDYPLIVCNSFNNFFGVEDTQSESIFSINKPFQLEVRYAYFDREIAKEETFYIDVLPAENIEKLIDNLIANEIDLAHQKISDDDRNREFNQRNRNQNQPPGRWR